MNVYRCGVCDDLVPEPLIGPHPETGERVCDECLYAIATAFEEDDEHELLDDEEEEAA